MNKITPAHDRAAGEAAQCGDLENSIIRLGAGSPYLGIKFDTLCTYTWNF